MGDPWLVVVDLQHAFRDAGSGWACAGFDDLTPAIEKLVHHFGERVVYTRFVRDPDERGGWSAYYDRWPDFRIPADAPLWELTLDHGSNPVVDAPTFSKWGPDLQRVVGDAPLVICGVATECCVMATALAAADAGREVVVVGDACAGVTEALHRNALEILHQNAPLVTVRGSDAVIAG